VDVSKAKISVRVTAVELPGDVAWLKVPPAMIREPTCVIARTVPSFTLGVIVAGTVLTR
jgi:hypothetical protein